MTSACRVAFVFAGGGALGAVEVGMLRALAEAQVVPDFVVGSSVGAINAAFFALHPTLEGIHHLEMLWSRCTTRTVFPLSIVRAASGLLGAASSLVDPGGLRRLLERHLGERTFAEAAIPCHVVAAHALTGATVVLSAGRLTDAVMASAAIPVVYPPVDTPTGLLVDGGVASNTPIETARLLGAARVFVLPTGFACTLRSVPTHPIANLLHTWSVLIARQLAEETRRVGGTADIRVVPPLCPLPTSAYDFSQSASLVQRAYEQTARWIAGGGLEAPADVGRLLPHDHGM